MSRAQQIQSLMEQLGPSIEGITNVTQITEDSWAVGFDEHNVVMLDLDDGGESLVLTVDVGRAGSGDRERMLETLLTYNALWRETGGVRMAMADGEVLQIASIPTSGLDLAGLGNIVMNVVERAAVWRQFVESQGAAAREDRSIPAGLRV